MNLTDAEGNVTKTYTYDAFGVEKNIDSSDTNAFRYYGEYFDTETDTVYLRARYYNPTTGRFISRNSYAGKASDPLSLNLYTYCRNNPIRYVDPSGHSFISDFGDKAKNAMQKIVFNTAVNKIVNAVGKAVNVLTNTIASKSNVDNKKHPDAPGCTKERFSPGCSGCNSVVVAREGKTNDANKRFNATITVYSLDGTKTDFVGSTLPDNIYGTYDDGRGHAKVKPGILFN